jgi:hypothetical protein
MRMKGIDTVLLGSDTWTFASGIRGALYGRALIIVGLRR